MNPFLTGGSTGTGHPYVSTAPNYHNSYALDNVCASPGIGCKDGLIP